MSAALLKLVPVSLRPTAKAVYAFMLPLVAQIVLAVTQNGVTVGNAVRSVLVAAAISYATHQVPNVK